MSLMRAWKDLGQRGQGMFASCVGFILQAFLACLHSSAATFLEPWHAAAPLQRDVR